MPPVSVGELRPAVFLDRDGVINRALVRDGKPYPPVDLTEFEILPGVAEACARLKQAGFVLVVATNQPDVGRGTMKRETVESLHAHMRGVLPLDWIEVCYHPGQSASQCDCRKPEPGMLRHAAHELGIDLKRSYMVGDRWRDIDCGHAAGCTTILIDYGYAEALRQPPDFRAQSLREAADMILAGRAKTGLMFAQAGTSLNLKMQTALSQLKVKLFADGADKAGILQLNANPLIQGMTTNPTLMRKAGIKDYEAFAKDVLQSVTTKPISFEVFSDDFAEMRRQALKIAAWQKNVYVKIPITNTRSESSLPLIRELGLQGVQLNITAILTLDQVRGVSEALNPAVASVVSVFAGRIADTGVDPDPMMRASKALLYHQPKAELLWASVREVLNIFQADACGCQIVTVPHDILGKAITMTGTDLVALSLDTVKMFAADAQAAGFSV